MVQAGAIADVPLPLVGGQKREARVETGEVHSARGIHLSVGLEIDAQLVVDGLSDGQSIGEGALRVGDTAVMGYVDQSRDSLDDGKNVWEEISGGNDILELGNREMNSRAYVSAFNFRGGDQQKKVGLLSGGERNRVHLAKMLKSGANLLLLDEPTNDLDVETLRALEEGLDQFAGCAVIISHDRWFLDRIATHILAFEGDSHVEWFEGNYADYEEDRKRRLGADAEVPKRIKYKQFSR